MTNYTTQTHNLYAKWQAMDMHGNTAMQQQFVIFCANMHRFRPEIPWQAMPGLFRRLKARIEWTMIDQSHPGVWQANYISGWDTTRIQTLREKPGIICTYHTGSYRLVCRMLANEGVRFALLVAKSVLRQQGPIFDDQYIHTCCENRSKRLKLIDAESSTALFAIRDTLRLGYQLVAYIDGNTGAGALTGGNNLVDVPFFQSALAVRSGLAHLAVLMDTPIYPVICTRPSRKHIRFTFLDPCYADKKLTRDANARRLMHRLYGTLERAIQQHPDEWEGWLYLHDLVGKKQQKPKKTNVLHKSFWGLANRLPIAVDDQYYALDLKTWLSYPIGQKGFNLLLRKHLRRTGLA